MAHDLPREVEVVHVEAAALAAHPALLPLVPVRHAEAPSLEAHEAVEGYPAPRAQVELRRLGVRDVVGVGHACAGVFLGRHEVLGPPVPARLSVAPQQRVLVEPREVAEPVSGEHVALHVPDEPLDLALRVRVTRLAQAGLEPDAVHERRVLGVPHGAPPRVAPGHDRPHVVGQDLVRDAHAGEGVQHADEEALLPRVGEELDVEGAAVVAAHREARDPSRAARVAAVDVHEPPVHLVRLARAAAEPLTAAPLRRDDLPLRRHEAPVAGDVGLDGREAALASPLDESLEDGL